MKKKIFGASKMKSSYSGNKHTWTKYGGYADTTFSKVKERAKKLGFKDGPHHNNLSPDGSTANQGKVMHHKDGHEIHFTSNIGSVKSDNNHSIQFVTHSKKTNESVDSDTYSAQRLYDKSHSEATKKGHGEKAAHEYASTEMKKKYPNHTASSGEGQVYKKANEEVELDEAFNKDKKDPRGGTVMIAVNPFHGGSGKYEVSFKPNRERGKIQRGRVKSHVISSHHDENDAEKAKHAYAAKHGYNVLRGFDEEVEQIEEMPGANMDTRAVHKHLRKSGWSLTRTKGSHDVYTHPKSERHIAVPRHKQLKAPLVRGIMKDAQVSEEIEQADESVVVFPSAVVPHRKSTKTTPEQDKKNERTVRLLKKYREKNLSIGSALSRLEKYNKKHNKSKVAEDIEHVEESRGHKILATKFAQIDARKQREAEAAKRAAEEQKKKEQVKEEKKGSWQKDTGWKKDKGDTTDKSGAKHTAMSRAKHLAKMASRKKVLEQDNNNQVDNVQTPAKKSLAFRGVVKNTIQPTKGKKVSSDDKFEPEPELNTQIMRNNF
jgi:predicted RNA binding protein YcfA (HicA-like mRNA interferase family)